MWQIHSVILELLTQLNGTQESSNPKNSDTDKNINDAYKCH